MNIRLLNWNNYPSETGTRISVEPTNRTNTDALIEKVDVSISHKWQITKKLDFSPNVSRFFFAHPDVAVALRIKNPNHFGKHFRVSADNK